MIDWMESQRNEARTGVEAVQRAIPKDGPWHATIREIDALLKAQALETAWALAEDAYKVRVLAEDAYKVMGLEGAQKYLQHLALTTHVGGQGSVVADYHSVLLLEAYRAVLRRVTEKIEEE